MYTSSIENKDFFKIGGLCIAQSFLRGLEYSLNDYYVGIISDIKIIECSRPEIQLTIDLTKKIVLNPNVSYGRSEYSEVEIKDNLSFLNIIPDIIPYTEFTKSLITSILKLQKSLNSSLNDNIKIRNLHFQTMAYLVQNCNKVPETVKEIPQKQ